MCGIAGIMTTDGRPPDGHALDELERALAHRGPDGSGRHISGGVGMVQTRLAVIDLETGGQPLYADKPGGGKAALVANGEIYNYIELKASMPGVPFATNSDCEPPLHLYLRHGVDFSSRLSGMYAIAIHDEDQSGDPSGGRLVLARDPFGIKPLYYSETAAGFVFASEPQALIRAGLVEARLDIDARDEVLQLQYTCGRRCAFQGIERLLPGETLVVERGRIAHRHRRPALPEGQTRDISRAEALKELDRALSHAVGRHQRSDVPYGMFLSGGIDSSALLAMMNRLNEYPVHAFTAGFDDPAVADERALARAVAHAAGADHHEILVTERDFWRHLPAIAGTMDDPVADYACLPTYLLAKAARRQGLKVILCGEGGDEIFAGYGRYRRAGRLKIFGGRPMRARGVFDGLKVFRHRPVGWRDGIMRAETEAALSGRGRLQQAQAADIADWLPNDLLTKLDRCLMASGVEGRVPFLDPELAGFAFLLPDRFKVKRRLGKWILRKWLETGLPKARPFKAKRGFTVPVGPWMASHGRELGVRLAAQTCITEICRPGAVENIYAAAGTKNSQARWTLLFYALWHRVHMEGADPAGGVFDVLEG